MSEHGRIEIVALAGGFVSAMWVVWITREKGIGPQVRLTLALFIMCPVLLVLGLEKLLSSETVAAIFGALVGAGVPSASVAGVSAPRELK